MHIEKKLAEMLKEVREQILETNHKELKSKFDRELEYWKRKKWEKQSRLYWYGWSMNKFILVWYFTLMQK